MLALETHDVTLCTVSMKTEITTTSNKQSDQAVSPTREHVRNSQIKDKRVVRRPPHGLVSQDHGTQ